MPLAQFNLWKGPTVTAFTNTVNISLNSIEKERNDHRTRYLVGVTLALLHGEIISRVPWPSLDMCMSSISRNIGDCQLWCWTHHNEMHLLRFAGFPSMRVSRYLVALIVLADELGHGIRALLLREVFAELVKQDDSTSILVHLFEFGLRFGIRHLTTCNR